MNTHQLGCRRDRQVIDLLQEWGTMDTEQIRLLLFPSARVAQRRLQRLADTGKVQRRRFGLEYPYYYYLDTVSDDIVNLNWFRLWLVKKSKWWEQVEKFDYLFKKYTVRNTVTDEIKEIAIPKFDIDKIREELR